MIYKAIHGELSLESFHQELSDEFTKPSNVESVIFLGFAKLMIARTIGCH